MNDYNDPNIIASISEERAENLSKTELHTWTAEMPHNAEILKKLKGTGAKLLCGPRGSGKSTLLRLAYFDLLESNTVLPAYINYARSMALEPLFHKKANAIQLFRQWVLAKIVIGIYQSLEDLKAEPSEIIKDHNANASKLVKMLEIGETPDSTKNYLSLTQLEIFLTKWAKDHGRKRVVLLLDDAAHAFSSEQQREFFEIFRSLKSRTLSAKAAVYPGVTSYSPNFHLGHEAELIEVWCGIDGANLSKNHERCLFEAIRK